VLSGKHGLKNERLGFRYYKRSPFLYYCGLVFLHHRLGYDVRWLIALVLTLALQSTGQDLCSVREFYGIAYTVHNPTERHQKMSAWLTKHQDLCKSSDMTVIWNNLSEWAGSADSAELRHKVVIAYKNAIQREKK
jgi:hypothetical protein